jgi:hypothetical protein
MLIGALGPWATALGLVSKAGVDGDGVLVVGAAIFAVGFLWNHAQTGGSGVLIAAMVIGLVSAAVCAYDLYDIRSQSDTEFLGEKVNLIQPGWGIYAALGGSVALVLASFMMWRARRALEPASSPPSSPQG